MEENFNTLLIGWLNNELTITEENSLKQYKDFSFFKSIIDGITKLKVPGQQFEKDAYVEFKQKLHAPPSSRKSYDDLLLGLLTNDLNKEEQELLLQSEAYQEDQSILDGIAKLTVPGQQSEEDAYIDFKQKLHQTSDETQENYDPLIAKWLNNDLTTGEQNLWTQSKHHQLDTAIIDGLSKLSTPGQLTAEEAYLDFKQKLPSQTATQSKKPKVIRLPILRYVSYAASFALIMGLSLFFLGSTSVTTQVAQQQTVVLPDNSEVIVNASSELSYNKFLFGYTRKLQLDGEAFFEVEKGSTFEVATPNGTVQVLGTKFNVVSRDHFFETNCYEGKVNVSSATNDDIILTKGKGIQYTNKGKTELTLLNTHPTPTWTQGVSEFKSAPLQHVINQLESQYPVNIDVSEVQDDLFLLYTGSFPHDNLDNALENVFLTMGINYSSDDHAPTIIRLTKKQ